MSSQEMPSAENNLSHELGSFFNPESACRHEAERCLRMIGSELADNGYDDQAVRTRARIIDVTPGTVAAWLKAYRERGLDGLLPQWDALEEKDQREAMERYKALGEFADAETITEEQIAELAKRNGWTVKRTKKWLRRYRTYGLWGLVTGNDPQKRSRTKTARRSLVLLDEDQLQEMYRRRAILGNLPRRTKVSKKEIEDRAAEVGLHPRTISEYLRCYREDGLIGLAPRRRSDRGTYRDISERMVTIIEGIYLSNPKESVQAIRKKAVEIAPGLGEPAPTTWQVRSICDSVSEMVKTLAEGDENKFRNVFQITHRIKFNGVVYQIDHTQVDVLLRDIRKEQDRTKSETVRAYLTLVIDVQSRLVMAAQFGYDRPDRFTVAAAIRDALLVSARKPYGGIPQEIWVDHGKELVSYHIRQLLEALDIEFPDLLPHQPKLRGIVERFFRTLNTRLWCTLPGYVGSNTTERPANVKAELTLAQLVEKFWGFIEQYHSEKHSETGQTPLEYWEQNCFAMPADPRLLDILLKEPELRQVHKTGVHYNGRVYWHPALGDLVGEQILLRAGPAYQAPDEIEVFHNEEWVCTAIATDSPLGKTVGQEEIAAAQSQQRQEARAKINEARAAKAAAENEIAAQSPTISASPPEQPQPGEEQPAATSRPEPKEAVPDLLDLFADER